MYFYDVTGKNTKEELPFDDALTTLERDLNGEEDDNGGFF